MNVGTFLRIIRDAINYLDGRGMILANGTVDFENLQNDLGFISAVEDSLEKNGVDVPDQVERITKALPLVIGLFGSK